MNEKDLERLIVRVVTEVIRRLFHASLADLLKTVDVSGPDKISGGSGGAAFELPEKKGRPGRGPELITETDVREAFREGIRQIRIPTGAIVTPLAKDAARDLGIRLLTSEVPGCR